MPEREFNLFLSESGQFDNLLSHKNKLTPGFHVSGAVALAGDIVLCFWEGHLTLTVPLSTQMYKWVPANLMLGGDPAMD